VSITELHGATLHFGGRTLFADVDLRIGEGERIGLLGPNGSGKTTLLKVLAGEQGLDGGRMARARGVRIGWLPQDLAIEGGRSLFSFVMGSVPGRDALTEEIERCERELNESQRIVEEAHAAGAPDTAEKEEALIEASTHLAHLHERQVHFDTFFSAHEAASILAGLGFQERDHDRDLGEFSGGWKMRAVLAALLFQRPDLLLLDEPTNHLDMPSVAWFGDFLRRSGIAFVLISHDREFVDEQVERIVSFEVEGVRQYKGNVASYLKQRAEEEIVLANRARNVEREREKAEEFIDRFRAKAHKAKAVQSRIKRLEKMETVTLFDRRQTMHIDFPPCERTSNEVVRAHGLAKSYGDLRVLEGVGASVVRGDKIGVIGVNGAGKTTLLKMLAGELAPTAGRIEYGAHVKTSYYAQHHADTLAKDRTIFETVSQIDPSLGQTRVRAVLGAFLFSGDDVDKKIGVLSGGERSRVALARMLVKPGNLLFFDEPTNHLDLESAEALAESLAAFDGTLVFVSHNRAFVRRLATKIWTVENHTVAEYPGTLDEYLESSRRRLSNKVMLESDPSRQASRAMPGKASQSASSVGAGPPAAGKREPASAAAVVSAPAAAASRGNDKDRKREEARIRQLRTQRLGPLEKKVATLEAKIAELEAEQKRASTGLADTATYADATKRAQLLELYRVSNDALETATMQWEIAVGELESAKAAFEASVSSGAAVR
jgi:ATP-binding cassette subfamily F protein 3